MSFSCDFCGFRDDRAVALVDTAALFENFKVLSRAAKGQTVIAVVKAGAYGHTAPLAVPALLRAGCRHFAVATFEEAMEVRRLSPLSSILILGYTSPRHAKELAACRLEQTVFSLSYGKELSRAAAASAVMLSIHLKVNEGMERLGVEPADIAALTSMATLPHLIPRGIFTHFPSAMEERAATAAALASFRNACDEMRKKGFSLATHAFASSFLRYPREEETAVRPGIALYGGMKEPLLSPTLSLYTSVVQLREVKADTPVGYGGTYVTKVPSLIATCPMGYADGLPRKLSGVGLTLLHGGRRFPVTVAGTVCMDQMMLDVTDTPAAVGDAILIFEDVKDFAQKIGAIPYEVLTALSPRVKRVKKEDFHDCHV